MILTIHRARERYAPLLSLHICLVIDEVISYQLIERQLRR